MNQIRTEKDLFNWVYAQVIESRPRITVSPGLLQMGEVIRAEIAEMGYLARYDYDCWVDTFEDI